jgi:hypothetical protein
VVIKVFFAVLVLSTAAVVAVILALHFKVKRHLLEPTTAVPESEAAPPVTVPQDNEGSGPANAAGQSSTPS